MNHKATLALGCFWQPEYYFSKLPGVVNTTVGYAGGTSANPTYETLGDHTETVEVVYDPSVISYSDILKHFWNIHDPTTLQKTQYKSIIFYHNAGQRASAEKSVAEEQAKRSKKILTEVREAGAFYRAEEYHQKYLEKQSG
jgi:peptide-methionine (S)-S-oxide reductase